MELMLKKLYFWISAKMAVRNSYWVLWRAGPSFKALPSTHLWLIPSSFLPSFSPSSFYSFSSSLTSIRHLCWNSSLWRVQEWAPSIWAPHLKQNLYWNKNRLQKAWKKIYHQKCYFCSIFSQPCLHAWFPIQLDSIPLPCVLNFWFTWRIISSVYS